MRYPERVRRAHQDAGARWAQHRATCEYCDRHHGTAQCADGRPLWDHLRQLAEQMRLHQRPPETKETK